MWRTRARTLIKVPQFTNTILFLCVSVHTFCHRHRISVIRVRNIVSIPNGAAVCNTLSISRDIVAATNITRSRSRSSRACRTLLRLSDSPNLVKHLGRRLISMLNLEVVCVCILDMNRISMLSLVEFIPMHMLGLGLIDALGLKFVCVHVLGMRLISMLNLEFVCVHLLGLGFIEMISMKINLKLLPILSAQPIFLVQPFIAVCYNMWSPVDMIAGVVCIVPTDRLTTVSVFTVHCFRVAENLHTQHVIE